MRKEHTKVPESSNPNINYITATETQKTSGGTPPPFDKPPKPETRSRRGVVLGVTAGSLALAAALAGGFGLAANNSGAKPPEAPSQGEPANIDNIDTNDTPDSTEGTVDIYTIPVDLQPYYDEAPEVFNARPIAERLDTLCGWEMQKLPRVGEDYAATSKNDIDLMPAISINNTPQEIQSISTNLLRLAILTPDVSLKAKIFGCAYEQPLQDQNYINLVTKFSDPNLVISPIQTYASTNELGVPIVNSFTESTDNDETHRKVTIEAATESGESIYTGTYVYVDAKTPNWVVSSN